MNILLDFTSDSSVALLLHTELLNQPQLLSVFLSPMFVFFADFLSLRGQFQHNGYAYYSGVVHYSIGSLKEKKKMQYIYTASGTVMCF